MGPPRLAPYERGHAVHRDEHPGFCRIGADAHLSPSTSEANIHRCTLAQTRLAVKRLTVVRMDRPGCVSTDLALRFERLGANMCTDQTLAPRIAGRLTCLYTRSARHAIWCCDSPGRTC
jgi:hypothetical protein